MDVRRRIAALALFGVQLLQGVLPAAGVDCERQAVVVATVAAAPAPDHQHHHAPADHAPADQAPTPHQHAPAACPMAMACTVAGVMSAAVAVSTIDVAIDVHRTLHVAVRPVSRDITPEPRPPRV